MNTSQNASQTIIDEFTLNDELIIILLRHIVYGWICLPISIVGLILNGFTIMVLLHPRMRTFSTNIYLTALSIANIVCLINYMFLYSIRYIISYDNFKKNIYDSHTKSIPNNISTILKIKHEINNNAINYENFLSMIYWAWSPIFLTFQLYSIYLTCAVTVDRWIYLLFPLKAERICTIRRTLTIIFCIFVFCVLFNLPRWFEVTYSKVFDRNTNRTIYMAGKTEFGNNKKMQSILHYYVYIIHVYGIPFSILLIVNIGIIHKLIQMKKRKSRLLGVGAHKPLPSANRMSYSSSTAGVNSVVAVQDKNKLIATPQNNHNNINNNNNNNNNEHKIIETSNNGGINPAAVPLLKSSSSSINNNNNVNNTTTTPTLNHKNSTNGTNIASVSAPSVSTANVKIDPKVTIMVLAVVISFFFCQFPYMMLTILSVKYQSRSLLILKTFSDLLTTINCCTNFFVYCLFSQKFRETATEVLYGKNYKFTKRNFNTQGTSIKRRGGI